MTDFDGRKWLALNAAEYYNISNSALQAHVFDSANAAFSDDGKKVVLKGQAPVSSARLITLRSSGFV